MDTQVRHGGKKKKGKGEVSVGDHHIRADTFVKLPYFFQFCVKTMLYKEICYFTLGFEKREMERGRYRRKQKGKCQLHFGWTVQAGTRAGRLWPPSTPPIWGGGAPGYWFFFFFLVVVGLLVACI